MDPELEIPHSLAVTIHITSLSLRRLAQRTYREKHAHNMRETLKAMVKVCNLPRDLLKYSHEIAFEKSETVEIPDLLPRNGVNRFESFIFI